MKSCSVKAKKHALSSNPYKLSVLMVLCQKMFPGI